MGGDGGGGFTGGDGGDAIVPALDDFTGTGGLGGSSFDADPNGNAVPDFMSENGSVNIFIPQASAVPAPASVQAGAALLAAMGLMKYRRRIAV